MASLLQKVHRLDAAALTARQAFDMGTRDGGTVLDLPVGRIEPGYLADFMAIDLGDLSLQPAPFPTSALLPNFVYASQPSAVRRVVVAGCEVARDGEALRVPAKEIAARVQTAVLSCPDPR